jgi:hypothetical protein
VAFHLRLGLIEKYETNFFRKLVKDVMEMRKSTGTTRKDFMQLLIELKEKGEIAVEKEDLHEVKEEGAVSDNTIGLIANIKLLVALIFFALF